MSENEAEEIDAKLRYLYGDESGNVLEMFNRLYDERMAGFYGKREGAKIIYNNIVRLVRKDSRFSQ